MNVLYILMAASFCVAGAFLAFFLWAARSGQFEDTQTPALRMLTDKDDEKPKGK